MEQETKKKNTLRYLIIGMVAVVVIGFGLNYWLSNRNYITTDNAQIDGDILSLRAGVTGYVQSIYVKDNQPVKKGDTLIIFKTEELLTSVRQAEAALENAKATIAVTDMKALASAENASASVLTSRSNDELINAAQANLTKAQSDLKRASELLAIKATTQEQYEAAQARLQIAKADYAKAVHISQSSYGNTAGLKTQAQAEKKQGAVNTALVQQRIAELNQAKEHLSRAYIIAPFDGIFSKRSVQEGQFLNTGQALGALINTNKIWVTANFKETQLSKMAIGQKAYVEIDAYSTIKISGTVDSWGGATGAKFSIIPPDNATGNYIKIVQRMPVRISIDNSTLEKTIKDKLFPGLSAVVKVKAE